MGEPVSEKVGEEAVELVRISAFSLAFSDQDPAHGGVAGSGSAQASGHGPQQSPRLRVRHSEGIENPQREDEFVVHRGMERHPSSMRKKGLCV